MQSIHVRKIESSPSHSQSQGKLRGFIQFSGKKIMYNLVSYYQRGVNWVKQLPFYSRVLNEDVKKVLNWMSPFELYYGRESKKDLLDSPSSVINETVSHPQEHYPTLKHQIKFTSRQRKIRKLAEKATEHCHQQMINHAAKQNPPSVYHANGDVLVRVRDQSH